MVALSPHKIKKSGLPEYLIVGGVNVEPVMSVRNLGAYFDMSTKQHVDAVCRKCNYDLRRTRSIRTYITKHVCHSLVIAVVVSSLDYCNALLLDLPEHQLTRLQKIHNRAARLVVLTPVSSHITPVLEQLHWLTVRQRIVLKVLVFIYKALHDLAPEYLSHLLHPRTRNRH